MMATFPLGHSAQTSRTTNTNLERKLNRETVQTSQGKITWIITAGDELTLRGIPAIGRGVAGAIRGTRPDSNIDPPT